MHPNHFGYKKNSKPKPNQIKLRIDRFKRMTTWYPENSHFSYSADQVKHHIISIWSVAIAETEKWHNVVENFS